MTTKATRLRRGRSTRALLGSAIALATIPALAVPALASGSGAGGAAHSTKAKASGAPRLATDAQCTPLGQVSDGTSATADLDGDAVNDFTVGLPNSFGGGGIGNGGGAIESALSGVGRQRLFDGTFANGSPENSDGFGRAVTMADLNHDLCADLVVGAPRGFGGAGRVTIANGSPAGVSSQGFQTLMAPTPVKGDRFGAALAIDIGDQTGEADLYVGAPGSKVDGQASAGAVYQYHVSHDGTVTLRHTFTESSAEVGLTAAAGDRFGAVLAPLVTGGVLVGVPDRAVSGHAEAGMAVYLHPAPSTGPVPAAQVITQDTPGWPGSAEEGDHFGASVDNGMIGVPGEDVGTVKDAGAVQTFDFSDGQPLTPGKSWNEASAGVPSKMTAGDRFGTAVVNATATQCQEVQAMAVGVPGKNIGKATDAGAVIVLPAKSGALTCPAAYYHQSGKLPGTAEAFDHVGATLSKVDSQEGLDEDSYDSILIGVPGEDLGSVVDAGEVQQIRNTGAPKSYQAVNGPDAGMEFGAVLSHPPAGATFN